MGKRRGVLVIFGLLDALLLGSFLHGIVWPGYVIQHPDLPLWLTLLTIAYPLFLISLAVSSFGLAMEKQWGIILSYVQFPFRYVFVLLSFGFLTLIPGPDHQHVIYAAMGLEAMRLVLTIAAHRSLRRVPASAAVPQVSPGQQAE